MNLSKWRISLVAAVVVGLLLWYFYPRQELPLGYTGNAPHLKDVPGKRPTVEIPTGSQYLKKISLTVNGQEVKQSEFTLQRGQEVDVQGRIDFDLGDHGEFMLSRISIASDSNNSQGFLIEGEALLHGGHTHVSGTPFGFDISKKWRVPDREGKFLLLVDYFAYDTEQDIRRRFAIVCPVILK